MTICLGVRAQLTRRGFVALVVCGTLGPLAAHAVTPPTATPTPVPSSVGSSTTQSASTLVGNDVSWPQCPKGMGIPSRRSEGKKMPGTSSKFIVIGLTNGVGFYANPCLASQVRWAKARHVHTAPYAFTTYPTAAQLRAYATKGPYKGTNKIAKLRNVGYAQAQFNVVNMRRAGLVAPFIWVDVEFPRPPFPWSSSRTYNKAVVDGVFAGYRAAGLEVGVYTSPTPWRRLIGTVRYRVPEWRTAGPTTKSAALRKCSVRSVQGGRIILGQWWIDDSNTTNGTDFNVLCPGFTNAASLQRFFTKY